jgi:predicted phosphoribosyltransferase
MRFKNREHAAHLLVDRLSPSYKNKNPLVLGIPRGAVPMAGIIADALGGELDVVLVRKLGHPLQPELAIGAIDENGNVFLSDYAFEIEPEYLDLEKNRQLEVLQRRRAQYTPQRRPIDAHDRIVIVVDDGDCYGLDDDGRAAGRACPKAKETHWRCGGGVAGCSARHAARSGCNGLFESAGGLPGSWAVF